MIEAKVVADSVGPDGSRLTTIQATGHRFILAEMNTHRAINKNSASSRAIPLAKQLDRIRTDLAFPAVWPVEQKGMQGGDELPQEVIDRVNLDWMAAADDARRWAARLGTWNVHKSIANRLLEPFMWHTMCLTATAWENFFDQRCTPKAQPEIRVMAEAIQAAMEGSQPRTLQEGEWHLPYVWDDHDTCHEAAAATDGLDDYYAMLAKISAARVARTSYLTQEGKRDIEADLRLYDETLAKFGHWSPMEQVGTPWPWNRQEGCIHFGQDPEADHDTFSCMPLDHLPRIGNLVGWRTLRVEEEAKRGLVTYR